ncbi:putative inorganic phosphate cotransporter isoform X2 [Contarinia nasturtii]|uniref:putative inorganic phosphate cotransporter isoform X2 n=1 Tax=Contarinia nasturtii TaxID=265458 RepID=UPI0012D40034|nr:putative inorganic phosphate cotransporter isoform X2 [Contarinia nasturtii]XP_031637851.1 putative inorganic phosphate cotransporter isoform X2 [Contarinia nasturtii]
MTITKPKEMISDEKQTESIEQTNNHKPDEMFGTRHFVTFMLFLGMANAYVMRTNMSVAIVAMVDHTAIANSTHELVDNECPDSGYDTSSNHTQQNGEFPWKPIEQAVILSSFFYGYVITQIPFGMLAKRYGARGFLGYGMLLNSVFAFFVPVAARMGGLYGLCVVRFIQGLGEGPIVPCTHAMLAKWIPPNERSRMGAAVYAGAQFGTIVSMPLSGLLSEYGFDGGWPSIFYVFGLVGVIWSVAFLFCIYEDPSTHPTIEEKEKKYILSSLWGTTNVAQSPPVPYWNILKSLPFYAILFAHMGQNYGYETLMTELPTYMKQVLRFSLKENGILSALPYLAMWLFSMFISVVTDWMIYSDRFTHTNARKIINSLGQYGPAICLIIASYTGCNRTLTVFLLTLGVGLNGAIYSGFKINHLDITPRFAGILMAITNCTANLAGLLAPLVAGTLINEKPSMANWQIVFFIAAAVYIFCATFYNLFGSGERQPWDNPLNDAPVAAIPIRQINGGTNNGVQSNGVQYNGTTPASNGQTQLNGNGVRETTQ